MCEVEETEKLQEIISQIVSNTQNTQWITSTKSHATKSIVANANTTSTSLCTTNPCKILVDIDNKEEEEMGNDISKKREIEILKESLERRKESCNVEAITVGASEKISREMNNYYIKTKKEESCKKNVRC